eukprot:1136767-Pelagomonas_calceolata.AAC.2
MNIACTEAYYYSSFRRWQPRNTTLQDRRSKCITLAAPTDEKPKPAPEVEETTKKFGLEAGLFKAFQHAQSRHRQGCSVQRLSCSPLQQVFSSGNEESKVSKADQAKQLLAQYGSAYLITSISFAIVSFGACYTLVNAGSLRVIRSFGTKRHFMILRFTPYKNSGLEN